MFCLNTRFFRKKLIFYFAALRRPAAGGRWQLGRESKYSAFSLVLDRHTAIPHTAYGTLPTAHSPLDTAHCTLNIAHCSLHFVLH